MLVAEALRESIDRREHTDGTSTSCQQHASRRNEITPVQSEASCSRHAANVRGSAVGGRQRLVQQQVVPGRQRRVVRLLFVIRVLVALVGIQGAQLGTQLRKSVRRCWNLIVERNRLCLKRLIQYLLKADTRRSIRTKRVCATINGSRCFLSSCVHEGVCANPHSEPRLYECDTEHEDALGSTPEQRTFVRTQQPSEQPSHEVHADTLFLEGFRPVLEGCLPVACARRNSGAHVDEMSDVVDRDIPEYLRGSRIKPFAVCQTLQHGFSRCVRMWVGICSMFDPTMANNGDHDHVTAPSASEDEGQQENADLGWERDYRIEEWFGVSSALPLFAQQVTNEQTIRGANASYHELEVGDEFRASEYDESDELDYNHAFEVSDDSESEALGNVDPSLARAAVTCMPLVVIWDSTMLTSMLCAGLAPMCTICQEEWEVGHRTVGLSECGHRFHVECMSGWASQGRADCPNCRTPLDVTAVARVTNDEEARLLV